MTEVRIYAVAVLALAMLTFADDSYKRDRDEDNIIIPKFCPKEDPKNTTIHLAHENDCTKFYKCQRGRRILFDCPYMDKYGNRLHFNARLQVCDWPCDAKCIVCGNQTGIPPTDETTTKQTPTQPDINDRQCRIGSADRFPHEWDCASYYQCRPDGTKFQRYCPPGLLYDAIRDICDSPEFVDCWVGAIVTPIYPDVCPPSWNDWITLLPHECQCNLFYLCRKGNMVVKECPKGLHFDKRRRMCDTPENAGCDPAYTTRSTSTQSTPSQTTPTKTTPTKTTPTETTPTETTPTKITPTESTPTAWPPGGNVCPPGVPRYRIPHETSCSKYYQCKYGVKFIQDCPPRLHFHPVMQICDFPENVKCTLEGSTYPTTVSTATPVTVTETTTKKPKPKPIPKECPPKGSTEKVLLPHECSCSKFYDCIDGEKVLDECPYGLHFDHIRQECDLPGIVNCIRPVPDDPETTTTEETTTTTEMTTTTTEMTTTTTERTTTSTTPAPITPPKPRPKKCPPKGSTEKVLLPHECSCSKFYNCIDGDKVLDECPYGLHFDHIRQLCDLPGIVNCIRPVPDDFETMDVSYSTALGAETRATSNAVMYPWQRPKQCPPRGSKEEVSLPHECSCSLFYKCVNGFKLLDSCLYGLHYDYMRQVCDKPGIVNCIRPVPDDILPTTTTTVTAATMKPASTRISAATMEPARTRMTAATIKPADKLSTSATMKPASTVKPTTTTVTADFTPSCPPRGSTKLVKQPHECFCSMYYTCVNGRPVLLKCPTGLHYDHIRKICDLPGKVNCIRPVSELHSESHSELHSALVPTAAECPPDGSLKIPHETNCEYYYQCREGRKTLSMCPSGLHFNRILMVCDRPANAGCETSLSIMTNVTKCPVGDTQTLLYSVHEEDCSLYYRCIGGVMVLHECPAGLEFNGDTGMCDYPEKAKCAKPVVSTSSLFSCPKNKLKPNVLLPHECTCNKYYRCVDGERVLETCYMGFHFDYVKEICDWPFKARCYSEKSFIPKDNLEIGKKIDKRPVEDSSTCTGICPSDSDDHIVLLPNPDCTKFCECKGGRAVVHECPSKLHYDPVRQICTMPDKAGCEKKDTGKGEVSVHGESKGTDSFWAKIPLLGRFFV